MKGGGLHRSSQRRHLGGRVCRLSLLCGRCSHPLLAVDHCRSHAGHRNAERRAERCKEGGAAWCDYKFANGKDAMEA